jgi:hypothetical protein
MDKKSRGRPKNDKIDLAVTLRIRAYESTSKADDDNIEHWLFKAGYTEEEKASMGIEKWNKLKNTCSVTFSKRRKTITLSQDLLPLWEKEITKNYIRFVTVPEDVVNTFTTIIQYFDSISRNKFRNLVGVNIQMLEITDFMKETRIGNQPILSYYKEFFKQQKMTEIGIVLKDLICTAMKNKNDNFDFQDPHQDYFPVAISSDNNKNLKKEWLAWSAIIPISKQGSWLTIWYDFQTPRTVEIKHGQVVFFRSDVVHCGGRPKVDMLQNQTYYRLHFFLQTKLQRAPKDKVNKYHFDGRTPFNALYTLPPEKQVQL